MFKLKIVTTLLMGIFANLFVASLSPATQINDARNYLQLMTLLSPASNSENFVAFSDFKDGYEEDLHKASLEYFDSHPKLIQRIRKDLDSQEVHWQLEKLSHRLLYAPESRDKVADLFTDYCKDAIADMLNLTGLSNPYCSISTFAGSPLVDEGSNPSPESSNDDGIKAFIVQNLAQEYMARYQFSGSAKKRIEIDLSGRISLNEVGSYSSYLQYSEDTQKWKFTHNKHTFWKSASANPYTVLMTPLEETLHIALRKYTEQAIMDEVSSREKIPSLEETQKVVEDWLAVEEAVVGGLVYKLVPDVLIKRIPELPMKLVQADLETKSCFEKYRFLPKAIKVVESHGLKESIHLYSQDPSAFRAMLTKSE